MWMNANLEIAKTNGNVKSIFNVMRCQIIREPLYVTNGHLIRAGLQTFLDYSHFPMLGVHLENTVSKQSSCKKHASRRVCFHIWRPQWVGEGGSPKSRQKEQNRLICYSDGSIYGSLILPLCLLRRVGCAIIFGPDILIIVRWHRTKITPDEPL